MLSNKQKLAKKFGISWKEALGIFLFIIVIISTGAIHIGIIIGWLIIIGYYRWEDQYRIVNIGSSCETCGKFLDEEEVIAPSNLECEDCEKEGVNKLMSILKKP